MGKNNTIETSCLHCGKRYKIPEAFIGKEVKCKNCGKQFKIEKTKKQSPIPLIGRLALSYKFINENQLKEVLLFQKNKKEEGKNLSFEEILIIKNLVDTSRMTRLHQAVKLYETNHKDKLFIPKAVKSGYVDQELIKDLLVDQKKLFKDKGTVKGLAELLVEENFITKTQLNEIITGLKAAPKIEENTKEDDEADPKSGDIIDESVEKHGEQMVGGNRKRKSAKDRGLPVDITTNNDETEAYVTRLGEAERDITVEDIKNILFEDEITYGIVDDTLIHGFLKHKGYIGKRFKVAQGKPASPGRNASMEYLFPTEYQTVGSVDEDGLIDFKDRGEIPHVKKGDVLVNKIPMIKSEPGINVYGEPIPVAPTRDVHLRPGKGVVVSDDKDHLIANTDGQPILNMDKRVSISQEQNIKGDVGYKTGHVEFDGNIVVSGTIQDGFKVRGDNIISNEILGAEIEAAGDVSVTGGIIGGTIRAKGNVIARYISKADIKAFGDVISEKEIVDSKILTSSTCEVINGKIISSEVTARKGIFSLDIGTERSSGCKLKVGVDDHVNFELDIIRQNLPEKEEKIERLKEQITELEEEGKRIQEGISKQAHVQDRGMLAIKGLYELKESGVTTSEKMQEVLTECDVTDVVARDKTIEELVGELNDKVKEADNIINEHFDEQDEAEAKIGEAKEEIAVIEKEVEEIREEEAALLDWNENEKIDPIVDVRGGIFSGTIIFANQSSAILKENYKNVNMKEIKVKDEENNTYNWKMRITRSQRKQSRIKNRLAKMKRK